jgi:hypothetical protein
MAYQYVKSKMSEQFIRRLTATDVNGVEYQIDYFRRLTIIPVAFGRPRRVVERVFKYKDSLLRRVGPGLYELDAADGPVRLTLNDV